MQLVATFHINNPIDGIIHAWQPDISRKILSEHNLDLQNFYGSHAIYYSET